jgi:hypothetical protein
MKTVSLGKKTVPITQCQQLRRAGPQARRYRQASGVERVTIDCMAIIE